MKRSLPIYFMLALSAVSIPSAKAQRGVPEIRFPEENHVQPALNAPAHEAYLQGLHDLDLRTKPAVLRAIAEFQQAIALDPNYAPAHAALARTYGLASVVGAMSSMESMPEAREAALRSIALDRSSPPGTPVWHL